nr:helix-turn-helix domain-containing protein [Pedobacter sp. MC2016-14]
MLNLFPIRKRLFTQLFKKEYASSPSDYSACARMELALEQLTKELKIREVSENLGYNAPETFSRAFKSYHGFLPSDVAIRQLT